VNHSYASAGMLFHEVAKIAATIAKKSPLSIRGIKEMVNYARDHSVADGLNYVATWNAAMLMSEDLTEAMTAARESASRSSAIERLRRAVQTAEGECRHENPPCRRPVGLTFAWASQAAEPLPLFDAHLHYNVEAAGGPYPLDHVLKLFRDKPRHRDTGQQPPNDGTRRCMKRSRRTSGWCPSSAPTSSSPTAIPGSTTEDLCPDRIRAQARYYQGIGEFHLFGNDAKSEWVKKTVDFAVANNLWLHAHSDDAAVDILFAHNRR